MWSSAQHPLLALRQERSERHLFLSEPGFGSRSGGGFSGSIQRSAGRFPIGVGSHAQCVPPSASALLVEDRHDERRRLTARIQTRQLSAG